MAKLHAELTAHEGGRVASKSSNTRLVLTVQQNNKIIGTLKCYPISDEPNGHRITWDSPMNGKVTTIIQNTDDIPR